MDVRIFKAIPEDLGRIIELHKANKQHIHYMNYPQLAKSIDKGNVLIAETLDDEFVGFIEFAVLKIMPWCSIYKVCVVEQCRLQGIGKALVNEVEIITREAGLKALRTRSVYTPEILGNKFLQAIGFTLIGLDKTKRLTVYTWMKEI